MRYRMVVVSLPRDNYYLCLHKHGKKELCFWKEEDRENFLRIREQIRTLYENGPIGTSFSRPEAELLYDPSLTPDQAVNRILPFYAEATPLNQKRVYYIERKADDVEIIAPAGTADEKGGLRLVVASKLGRLELPAHTLEAVGDLDLDTLEGRSDRSLVAKISRDVTVRDIKILAIPAERRVKLSTSAEGEFVTEIPEVWA